MFTEQKMSFTLNMPKLCCDPDVIILYPATLFLTYSNK